MDEEGFVIVRVSEIVLLGGSVAQGIGDIKGGGPCIFYGKAERMVEIAHELMSTGSVEVAVRRSALRLLGGLVPLGGGSESTGVTGSDPVTGDARRLP